jgi:hypothetical protein
MDRDAALARLREHEAELSGSGNYAPARYYIFTARSATSSQEEARKDRVARHWRASRVNWRQVHVVANDIDSASRRET